MKKNLRLFLLTVLGTWMAGSAWAIDPDANGVYQIGTADQLIEFANMVNGDASKSGVTAKLTADIDLDGKTYVPIGRDNSRFWGTFDGQGHRIKNMRIEGSTKELGLFSVVSTATIKNLILDASCVINSGDCTAALIGCCNGSGVLTIENVGIECNVKGTGPNAAAFIGCNYSGGALETQIKNCYNTGNIEANRESAVFCGWFANNGNTRITNCWNTGKVTGQDGNNSLGRGIGSGQFVNTYDLNADNAKIDQTKLTGYDADWLTSGKLCYTLNGDQSNINWYQNLTGTVDAYPVPFSTHAQVYANGTLKCDGTSAGGELTYSNSSTSTIPPHTFEGGNGWCTVCHTLNENYLTADTEGFYSIGTANDLKWFADYVEKVNHAAKAKLTADIDFSDQTNMIGNGDEGDSYQGVFDGQGHKVKVAYAVSQKNVALFRYLKNANIKNLITEGTINNENNSCAGGIFAGSRGNTVVENCVSYVTLSRSNGGDATFGGIGAYMHDNGKIKNCAFYGKIETPSATGNGGLLGYANGGSNIAIENCIVNASAFTYSSGSVSIARNTGNVKHTYVVNAGNATQTEAKTATAEQVASGELAFIINSESESGMAWYQKLGDGADAAPLPFGTAIVYQNGDLYCDGTSKGSALYSNTEGQNRDNHVYGEWGLCTNSHDGIVCDDTNPDFATKDGEYYLLDSKQKLNWFALFVNQGKGNDANAKLIADIDMAGINAFPGIGNADHNYAGTFDGQLHKISNLVMNWDQQGVGLISRATNGVHVLNLTIDNTCKFTGKEAVAAFIGGTYGNGGSFIIEKCGNEAEVNATSKNAGAFLGCNYANDQSKAQFLNCYNTGAINSTAEGGAFSGWAHKAFTMTNCYNTGALSGCEGFARGYEQVITNCWSTNNTANGTYGRAANNEITDITDGTVFAALFDAAPVWHMDFAATTPHPVLYDVALVLDENFPNRFVAGTANLTLKRTLVKDNWNTICLPFDLNTSNQQFLFGLGEYKIAELTGADGETLQFSSVTGTMTAGKAYLVKPVQNVTSKVMNGVTLVAGAPVADEQGGYAFTGIYEPTLIPENDLFVAAGNKLQPSDGTGKLKGFRAYFKNTTDGAARVLNFVVDGGETTGIIAVDGTVIENGSAYTLGGQRVAQPTKGLYIVNGKKVVVK